MTDQLNTRKRSETITVAQIWVLVCIDGFSVSESLCIADHIGSMGTGLMVWCTMLVFCTGFVRTLEPIGALCRWIQSNHEYNTNHNTPIQ
ncbi:hypothetical protein COB72_05850 [bacterium]|nr:MAG: hypothetical protein COB72_05850 [bacterium]